jgi:hypothetical protein
MAKRDGFPWKPIRRAKPIRLRFTLARDPQRGHSKLHAWPSVWLIRSPRRWRADDKAASLELHLQMIGIIAGSANARSLILTADHDGN